MGPTNRRMALVVVLAAAACGGVTEPGGGDNGTSGAAGDGAAGGTSGTGGTSGAGGIGATGGMAGVGGTTAPGGAGGGPSGGFLDTCLAYVQMAAGIEQPDCADCLAATTQGPCMPLFEPVFEETGPCGDANTCGNGCVGDGTPGPEGCSCLRDCLDGSFPQCEEAWEGVFNCMTSACGQTCS